MHPVQQQITAGASMFAVERAVLLNRIGARQRAADVHAQETFSEQRWRVERATDRRAGSRAAIDESFADKPRSFGQLIPGAIC